MDVSQGRHSLSVFSLFLLVTVLVSGNAVGQVTIESPAKNTVVSMPVIHVSGTVTTRERNFGVTVNDVAAFIDLEHVGTPFGGLR